MERSAPRIVIFAALACALGASSGDSRGQEAAAQGGAPSAQPQSIPFPHPVISEILAFVPNTNDVDPSRDNVRDPVGDEFIELVNPHTRPIDLTGYVLADALAIGRPDDERGVRFVFPKFTLGPGEVVVVFNGYNTGIAGAHGTPNNAPTSKNDKFENAWVFTMNNSMRFRSLNNSDEMVVLLDASGKAIDAVSWGEPSAAAPEGCLRVQTVKRTLGGSYVRTGADGVMEHHTKVGTTAYSPGKPYAGATK